MKVNVFLGGGVELLEGNGSSCGYNNSVVQPVVGSLNGDSDKTDVVFIVSTFKNLTKEVVTGRKQDVYHKYICEKAHVAIFILDGSIGDDTQKEIEKAYDSFSEQGHPIIYIYGINLSNDSKLVKYLRTISEYYNHFSSDMELKLQLQHDLMLYIYEKRHIEGIGKPNNVILSDDVIKTGYGSKRYDDGRTYVGFWKNGRRNGHGVCYWPNGESYVGEWKNNCRAGDGTYSWPTGSRYEGEWKNDRMSGHGIRYFKDGSKYDGDWKDGKRNGIGTLYFPNGERYEGEWVDGVMKGYGIRYNADGSKSECIRKNGRIVGHESYHESD